MQVHARARLTPNGRALVVERVLSHGWSAAAAAEAAGVAERTVYRWLARYRAQGESGLLDRSSAPHSIPRRRPRERVAAILAQVLDFFQRELDSGEYPNLRDFLGDDVDAGVERIAGLLFDAKRFDRGLKRLLDGIEASLPG